MMSDLLPSGSSGQHFIGRRTCGSFYSHLESENYASALAVTRHTLNNTPARRRVMGSPVTLPNDSWLQGYSFLSSVAQYGNDLPQAEKITRNWQPMRTEIRAYASIMPAYYRRVAGRVRQKRN